MNEQDYILEDYNDVDDYVPPPGCPVCDGPGIEMGGLGNVVWYRCRNCGIEFKVDIAPDPAPFKEFECRLSMTYSAVGPADAAKQFIGNLSMPRTQWYIEVIDPETGQSVTVDTEDWTVE